MDRAWCARPLSGHQTGKNAIEKRITARPEIKCPRMLTTVSLKAARGCASCLQQDCSTPTHLFPETLHCHAIPMHHQWPGPSLIAISLPSPSIAIQTEASSVKFHMSYKPPRHRCVHAHHALCLQHRSPRTPTPTHCTKETENQGQKRPAKPNGAERTQPHPSHEQQPGTICSCRCTPSILTTIAHSHVMYTAPTRPATPGRVWLCARLAPRHTQTILDFQSAPLLQT
mmetsp:Transcript_22833/g.58137  ORF Transcript_22833/g.58137 Transcript_22833/m.58137 type:complete len:228 (-) Transcript_22833:1455-2138(-)